MTVRILLSWLREVVPVEAEPEDLAARLSMAGLKVEAALRTGVGIEGVVVGEVLDVRDHPGADNLVLVGVDHGGGRRDVVCGARNFAPGDRVPVAVPGARLPGGIEVGARTVRGQRSDGMLCSARELEISEDHAGILVLGPDVPVGADVRSGLGLDDVVFDVEVTPNRPDALSVVGVAREVAAAYGLPLRVPEPALEETGPLATSIAEVRIEDPRGCPRYLARVVTGLRIGPSPWWMRWRLLASGMRPVSNVVDVTNYVLLERGHPLHAFDLARLRERNIVIRRPRRGERLRTLDGVERVLDRSDVAICDAERPVAVAGVMGGAETEVGEGTSEVLLESAYFDPARIGRTARRLGLRTEASIRFERGADPEGVPAAAARAAGLLARVAGGAVARGAIDLYPRPARPRRITLRTTRTNALLGIDATSAQIGRWLASVGCRVVPGRGTLRVEPPSFRPDLRAEEDLLEEVARLYGFDRIPATLPANRQVGALTPAQAGRRAARRALLGAGLFEAQTLSLLPPWLADRLEAGPDDGLRRAVRVANPLSEEESLLRPGLVPGLLLAARRNAARGQASIALFEIGTSFLPGRPPEEREEVAWVLAGEAPRAWHCAARPYDLFDSKGVLEALASALGVTAWSVERTVTPDWAHPGRRASVLVRGVPVGFVFEVHPRAARALDLPARVVCGSLRLDGLLGAASEVLAAAIPRFPAALRDIAIVLGEETPAAEVQELLRRAGGEILESATLFDVWRGDPIPPESKSLAFSLSLRDPERTLTDADADRALEGIHEAVRAAGWSLRT
ncbi:MAG: phenylalanine--tRNA ligase subunit beta [Acidobacteria bacterium]|nr:phenylalanine--tRNA ligase subunit beta [Acidobacteriota bacterium]